MGRQHETGRDMVSRLMAEVILSGGCLWTRQSLYQELYRQFSASSDPEDRAHAMWVADLFAFGEHVLLATEEDIAARAGGPLDRRNG